LYHKPALVSLRRVYTASHIVVGSGKSVKTLANWFPTEKIPLGSLLLANDFVQFAER